MCSIFIRKKQMKALNLQNCKYENLDNIFKELLQKIYYSTLYTNSYFNFTFNFNEIKRKYKFL